MAIEVISKLKPKNNGDFKIADATDIEYTNSAMEGVANVSDAIDRVYSILNTEPQLTYINQSDSKQYWAIDSTPYIECRYTTSIVGKYTVTVTCNGAQYITRKQNGSLISIILPKVTSQGTYVYNVTVSDSFGNSNSLLFTLIYGGVTIASTFDITLKDTVYSVDEESILSVPISINYAETGGTFNRLITYDICNANGEVISNGSIDDLGTNNITTTLNIPYRFSTKGLYTLKLKGLVEVDNSYIESNKLEYTFSVLNQNSIATSITEEPELNLNTDSAILLSYRIVTNLDVYQGNNQLRARLLVYKLNENGERIETPIKDIYVYNITSGVVKTWNIGRLMDAGNYEIEIYGEPANGITTDIAIDKVQYTIIVNIREDSGYTYCKENLIAYFNAEDKANTDTDSDIWQANNSPQYYIKLHGLNYDTNGWIEANDDRLTMLSFTGDSYGEMRYIYTDAEGNHDEPYCPMSAVTEASQGHTLEMVFRSKCIGELKTDVMTCRNDLSASTGGYTLRYDSATITALNGKTASRSLSEDRWTHVCFVLDREIRDASNGITNNNIENLNNAPTMRIYIDGCLSSCEVINNWKFFESKGALESRAMQLLLNASYDSNGCPSNFGTCDIKLIRLYNAPLKSSQVLSNYINSIRTTEGKLRLKNKNDSSLADIPVIHFVKNKVPFIGDKASKSSTFVDLHSITKKKSDDSNEKTSKNSWINCTMWYKYRDADGWHTVTYEDVDVYLQGTSSLTYPIKNYQIKLYDSTTTYNDDGTIKERIRGSKLKIIPPNKTNDLGWVTTDNVFTLKCDYMEQSHKNNTCTAIFYEELISEINNLDIIKFKSINDKLSIAKQQTIVKEIINDNGESVSVNTNKFRDAINGFPVIVYYNDNTNDELDVNEPDENGEYLDNANDIYAGTYMFNVDKEGKQLGFEIGIEQDEQLTYTNDDGESIELVDKDGNPIKRDIMPCVSLEGTSNSSFAAAGAFYTLEDYKREQEESGATDIETFSNKYKYIEASLEPRFSYADDFEDILTESYGEDEAKKIMNHLTFDKMAETIEWVSANSDNRTKFREEFENYFSFTYCLAYYLQMMVFTQVDNAGKNAMFDTWGGVFYPRPYDMDTQMGLNNSGEDKILPSAEVSYIMSNASITGNFANIAWVKSGLPSEDSDGNIVEYDPNSHLRFVQYNTRTSKLWNAFATHFFSEISTAYSNLRSAGIYNVDHICSLVESYTSEVIGESFYNKDAAAKYINTMEINEDGTIDTKYLYACQGNRSSRYRQFLEQRLIFLDTKFGYKVNNLNGDVTLRSYVPTGSGNKHAIVGISTYSPQYITISMGTDCTVTAYVDQDSQYKLNGITYDGILINLPFEADNKDWMISGAGNIKTIDHMPGLHLELCQIGSARKLTNVAITNSNILQSFEAGTNTYLRTINLHGNRSLKSSITLENCINLKSIDVSDSSISGLTLPTGAPISSINLQNCKIGSLSLSSLQFINDSGININGCNSMTSLTISNCPNITKLDITNLLSLQSLNINNAIGLTDLNLSSNKLSTFNIALCDNLESINMNNCDGSILSNLNLSTVYGLKTLSLVSASYDGGIRIQLPKYKQEYINMSEEDRNKLPEEETRWNALTKLTANSSNLIEVRYDSNASTDNPIVDLEPLSNLNEVILSYNKSVKKIIGFIKNGSMDYAFDGCSELEYVSGKVNNCFSLACAFAGCKKLGNFDLEFINSKAENANMLFYYCSSRLSINSINSLLAQNPNITHLNAAFYSTGISTLPTINILSKLETADHSFAKCNMTSIPDGFLPSSIKSARGMFSNCTSLTTVPFTLFKNCTNLTTLQHTFLGCTALTTFLSSTNASYTDFDVLPIPGSNGTNKLTNIAFIFSGCTALNMPNNGTLYDFFKNSKNLTHIDSAFNKVTNLTNDQLVNDVLKENILLKSIHGLFYGCTGLTSLPDRLFSNKENSHKSLRMASGVFANCTNITGRAKRSIFKGAKGITCLGYDKSTQHHTSNDSGLLYTPGFFANTAIDSYDSDLLEDLTELTNVSCLFAKGDFKNGVNTDDLSTPLFVPAIKDTLSYSLINTYIPNKEDPVKFHWSDQLFKNNSKLKYADCAFAGNLYMEGFCDKDGVTNISPEIFSACKDTLESVDGLFAQCAYSTIDDENNTIYLGLSEPIHNTIFKGLTALKKAKGVFLNCYTLQGSLNSDFLKDCESLETTAAMFYNCKNLGINDSSSSESISNKIFDSCRGSLLDTSFMFYYCGFAGQLGIGTKPTTDENTVTIYNDKGLLSDCVKLTSTKAMFANCRNLKGAIPQDIFYTINNEIIYTALSDISEMFYNCFGLGRCYGGESISIIGGNPAIVYDPYTKNDDNIYTYYLIPNNWLSRCPNISNIKLLFCNIASADIDDNVPVINESAGYDTINSVSVTITDSIFNNQTKITNASYAFGNILTLTGSLSNEFMKYNLSNLSNVSYIFVNDTRLSSVGGTADTAIFQLSNGVINNILKNVSYAFSGCSGLTGYATSQNLVRFTSSDGMVYICTGLSNYSSYTSNQKSAGVNTNLNSLASTYTLETSIYK